MARLRVGVLISGRGSNMQALMQAAADPDYPAEVVQVISNHADALGLARAREMGIPTAVINHRAFNAKTGFEAAVDSVLRNARVDLVCLAGFMRILTPFFVERWYNRLLNIHPSLLPAYKGLETHERVLADGVRVTGCTVHFVRPAMDEGPIIVQAAVPVLPGDDVEKLSKRVLAAEHVCYPLAIRLLAEGRVEVVDEKVVLHGALPPATPALINPAG